MKTPSLIDTHCHLDYIQQQEPTGQSDSPPGSSPNEGFDAVSVLARAREAGVECLINPGVTPSGFPALIALAERFENVYAALAVHPTDVGDIRHDPDWLDKIEALLSHPKVVAIGETGLDYYRDTSEAALQQQCFKALLTLGARHDVPVIVHDREAHEDVARMITETPDVRGVMHCFSGDAALAERLIAQGFYISFAGNLTFPKAHNLHEAARVIPLEHLLVETDAPFLSPVPFRGKPNEPARVRLVAEKIAELKGIDYEEVVEMTSRNTRTLFSRIAPFVGAC